MTSHENMSLSFQTFLHFLKIYHKIFNSSKLVNFFLSEDFPSVVHSKSINVTGRECQNFETGWLEVLGHSGKNVNFFLKVP